MYERERNNIHERWKQNDNMYERERIREIICMRERKEKKYV